MELDKFPNYDKIFNKEKEVIVMSRIKNHNVEPYMCNEKTCSNKADHYFEYEINNLIFVLIVCEKHARQLEALHAEDIKDEE